MSNRDNLPAKTGTRLLVVPTEKFGSLVRRGLAAVKNRQKRALPLKGKTEWETFEASRELAGTPPYHGDAEAQFNFAEMYFARSGDSEKQARIWAAHQATKWWKIAAERGYAPAQFRLGDAYHEGCGLPQNYALAVDWWHKAAEQGCAAAQYKLGCAYSNGEGVTKDFVTAYMWFSVEGEVAPIIFYDPGADQQMEHLESFMTLEEIAEAKRLVREWTDNHAS